MITRETAQDAFALLLATAGLGASYIIFAQLGC